MSRLSALDGYPRASPVPPRCLASHAPLSRAVWIIAFLSRDRFLIWDFDGTLAFRPGNWTGVVCEVVAVQRPDLGLTSTARGDTKEAR